MSKTDGDVESKPAGDHEDIKGEHRAHHELAPAVLALRRDADQLWVREVVRIPDLVDSPLALLGEREDVTFRDLAGEAREVWVLRLVTVRVCEEQVVIDGVDQCALLAIEGARPDPCGAGASSVTVARRPWSLWRSRC
jgi:hypothetical protein